MKYLLLMYAEESKMPAGMSQEDLQKAWVVYMKEAQASGALLSNEGIAPASNATTVRVRNGKTMTTDGPFAETHEQLGGYSVLECKDLDEAVSWAAKIPTAKFGSIEVRPLWSPQQK